MGSPDGARTPPGKDAAVRATVIHLRPNWLGWAGRSTGPYTHPGRQWLACQPSGTGSTELATIGAASS